MSNYFLMSFSQLNLFEKCQRNYYYKYVLKLPDIGGDMFYAVRGTTVHKCLEMFYNKEVTDLQSLQIIFNKLWDKNKINDLISELNESLIKKNRQPLNKEQTKNETWNMVVNGVNLKLDISSTEFKIFYPDVIGYLDVINTNNGGFIGDFKTSTFRKENFEEYKKQVQFYAYLNNRKFKFIPKVSSVFYLKINKTFNFNFNETDIKNSEKWYLETRQEIQNKIKLNNVNEWSCNYKSCFFCNYKEQCRSSQNILKYRITIKGNNAFLSGPTSDLLMKGIDKETRFDLPGKFFMQKFALEKTPNMTSEQYNDVGRVHLFNKNYKMFQVGFIQRIKKILYDYAEYTGKKIDIEIEDLRDSNIHNKKLDIMPEKLNMSWKLMDFQIKAINSFIKSNTGYLQMATGAGKTVVTAEIIRELDTPTLWIIDKKELLHQTKEEFEKFLGIEIGIIGDGEKNIKNVTLSTIQTLSKNINDYIDYLKTINLVIVDEAHHSSATSYKKVFNKLVNTKYRLGVSATVKRTDGCTNILHSLIGEIIYDVTSEYLISIGFLMKPDIKFIKLKDDILPSGSDYASVYNDCVVDNKERNDFVSKITDKHKNEKILILTNRVIHGEEISKQLNCDFICGTTSSKIRKTVFNEFKNGDLKILVGTYSIFSEGINIPVLKCIINLAAPKSDIKTIQIIGRILRKAIGKTGCVYYDFLDKGKYPKIHSKLRIEALENEGHKVKIVEQI